MAHTGDSVTVRGLAELRRGLKKAEAGADKAFAKSLRAIGAPVLAAARANAPVGPRPKRSSSPPLAASLRLSVSAGKVSVYSTAPHANVINWGGAAGHGAVMPARSYLTKAVAANRATVETEFNRALDALDHDVTES